jgi:hypothetical protein
MDRCIPAGLKRKTDTDDVQPYRERRAKPEGEAVRKQIEEWVGKNRERACEVYAETEPLDIPNDRLAEMMVPLMVVVKLIDPDRLPVIREYVQTLEERERDAERQTPGVQLLAALREIFTAPLKGEPYTPAKFLSTAFLIVKLVAREEEPWARFTRGAPISPEALATLLRPYGIRSQKSKEQKHRGYVAADFEEPWERYLPAPSGKPA